MKKLVCLLLALILCLGLAAPAFAAETETRTFYYAGNDTVSCTMEGTFTPNTTLDYVDYKGKTYSRTGITAVLDPNSSFSANYFDITTLKWDGTQYVQNRYSSQVTDCLAKDLFVRNGETFDVVLLLTTEGWVFLKLSETAQVPETPETTVDPALYGSYGVESGYSLTYFTGAYSEKARSITCPETGADVLIPLNVQSGSTIGFGGMDGYAFPIPFYKATYDAASGTLENLISIPLEHQFDDYGCAMEITVDTLFQAAAAVEGNAVVFSGYPGMDSVNEDVYFATILLRLDGAEPPAPVIDPTVKTITSNHIRYTLKGITSKETRTIPLTVDFYYDNGAPYIEDTTVTIYHIPVSGATLTAEGSDYYCEALAPMPYYMMDFDRYGKGYFCMYGSEYIETPNQWNLTQPKSDKGRDVIYMVGDMYSSHLFFVYDQPEVTFPDVKQGAWYSQTVAAAAKTGMILGTGSGSFAPNVTVTWAQAVTFAVRLHQYMKYESVYGAEDQTGANWYDIYMDYALEFSLIDEIPANPNAVINRTEAFNIFSKVLGYGEEVNDVPSDYFTDLTPDHPAYEAAYKLARAGISNGTGNNKFGPDKTLTRAEVATLIARMAGLVDLVKIP